jgi:hypothetical protein
MPSGTKWYLTNKAAPYEPATYRGSWNTNPNSTKLLDMYKQSEEAVSSATRAEASATVPFRLGVWRGVSRALAAQTIAGTIDLCIGVSESNADADFYTKVYIYATVGSTDVVRGVILDYEETSGGGASEWPVTSTGKALLAAQALSSTAVLEGDRLVIEFGVLSENVHTNSRTATVRLGTRGTDFELLADLTVGSTSTTTLAGFFEFSAAIALSNTVSTNVTPETALALTDAASGTIDFEFYGNELWYTYTALVAGGLGFFPGVSSNIGNLDPKAWVKKKSGATYPEYLPQYLNGVTRRSLLIPVAVGDEIYIRITDLAGFTALGRSFYYEFHLSPTTSSWVAGTIFISGDAPTGTGFNEFTGTVINKGTGEVLKVIPNLVQSERGATALGANGHVAFSNKLDYSEVKIFTKAFVPVATVAGMTISTGAGGEVDPPISFSDTYFYSAQYQSGVGTYRAKRCTLLGVVDPTNYDLTLFPAGNSLDSIAVTRDDTKLYYAPNDDGA